MAGPRLGQQKGEESSSRPRYWDDPTNAATPTHSLAWESAFAETLSKRVPYSCYRFFRYVVLSLPGNHRCRRNNMRERFVSGLARFLVFHGRCCFPSLPLLLLFVERLFSVSGRFLRARPARRINSNTKR